jgi:4-aminobutyrate aminotransferase-like enzyme
MRVGIYRLACHAGAFDKMLGGRRQCRRTASTNFAGQHILKGLSRIVDALANPLRVHWAHHGQSASLPVWARAFDIHVERGEGIYLYDKDGRRYMDFTCGIGVTNTGHAHPRIVRAIQEQAARLLHGQIGIAIADKVLELTDELASICPPELDTFFFSNSGAEAVEAAIKLAKQATGRTNVIAFEGSFHGRTH